MADEPVLKPPKIQSQIFTVCPPGDTSWYCVLRQQIREKATGGPGTGSEALIVKIDEIIAQGLVPDIDLIVDFTSALQSDGWNKEALDLTDVLPEIIPLNNPHNASNLGAVLQIRGRILDKLEGRRFDADMAFTMSKHFTILAGRLQR